MRATQLSVTCFVKCQDKYLFVHRTNRKNKVDGNKLNGVGGKLEPGEDFLRAALRETEEETGYSVPPQDCHLAGMVRLEGGYEKDWVMGFFVLEVPDLHVPRGMQNDEGELYWIDATELHTSGYELVDDLNYLWHYITNPQHQPFFAAAMIDDDEKVQQLQVSTHN